MALKENELEGLSKKKLSLIKLLLSPTLHEVSEQQLEKISVISEQQLEKISAMLSHTISEALTKQLEQSSAIFNRNILNCSTDTMQKNLIATWKLLQINGIVFHDFNEVGFSTFSQNNEDGIILYLLSILGTEKKLFVEIGANCIGSKIGIPENNTTNLAVYHGWNGLIIDGSENNVNQLTHFFARCLNTKHYHWQDRNSKKSDESSYFSPICKQAFISPENINSLLLENRTEGEIDLFSLDIDGMDYHVWKALDVISPRIVIIEFNQKIDLSIEAIPKYIDGYQMDIDSPGVWENYGCSLTALINLGKKKGYRLVGISSGGFNAIFIRNDVGSDLFKEISIDEINQSPLYHWHDKKDYTQLSEYQEYWEQLVKKSKDDENHSD